jgi:sec-independent protein translocase protein TatA
MLTPSVPELILILVVVLVIFGPSKLPGIGQSLGKAIKNFKGSIGDKPETPENTQANQAAPVGRIEQQAVNAQIDPASQNTRSKVN